MTSPNDDVLSLEERKLALEEKKLEIEIEKLKVERFKGWATGGSIVISLLAVGLTIAFGVWSQHKQVMSQIDLQDRQAKAQFEIKAAEIVMNTNLPAVTRNKAQALLALFPGKLPQNFAQSFAPGEFERDHKEYLKVDDSFLTERPTLTPKRRK